MIMLLTHRCPTLQLYTIVTAVLTLAQTHTDSYTHIHTYTLVPSPTSIQNVTVYFDDHTHTYRVSLSHTHAHIQSLSHTHARTSCAHLHALDQKLIVFNPEGGVLLCISPVYLQLCLLSLYHHIDPPSCLQPGTRGCGSQACAPVLAVPNVV